MAGEPDRQDAALWMAEAIETRIHRAGNRTFLEVEGDCAKEHDDERSGKQHLGG
jgi:hypothetical protein